MENTPLRQLKITATNIKSSLFSYNKRLNRLRSNQKRLTINREKMLLSREKEKKVESSSGKNMIQNFGSRIMAGPLSFFDKVKEFFGLVFVGLLINNLPKIINGLKRFFGNNPWIIPTIKFTIDVIGQGLNGLIYLVTQYPDAVINNIKRERDNVTKEIDRVIAIANSVASVLGGAVGSLPGIPMGPGMGMYSQPGPQSKNAPSPIFTYPPVQKKSGGTITGRSAPSGKSDQRTSSETQKVMTPFARPGGSAKMKKARESYNAFGDFYDLTRGNIENYTSLGETSKSLSNVNVTFSDFLFELQRSFRPDDPSTTPPIPPGQPPSTKVPPGAKQGYKGPLPSSYGGRGVNPPFGENAHGYPARDYRIDDGAPISVFAPGKVIFAGDSGSGYGNMVKIQHDSGQITLYAHLSSIRVKVGDIIEDGSSKLIGNTGGVKNAPGAGNSTGPHLHFEMRDPSGKTYMDYNTGDKFFRFSDKVTVGPNQKVSLHKSTRPGIYPLKKQSTLYALNEDPESESETLVVFATQQVIQKGSVKTVVVNSKGNERESQTAPTPQLSALWA